MLCETHCQGTCSNKSKKKTVGFSFACSQPLLLGKLKVRSIYDKAQRLCASVA